MQAFCTLAQNVQLCATVFKVQIIVCLIICLVCRCIRNQCCAVCVFAGTLFIEFWIRCGDFSWTPPPQAVVVGVVRAGFDWPTIVCYRERLQGFPIVLVVVAWSSSLICSFSLAGWSAAGARASGRFVLLRRSLFCRSIPFLLLFSFLQPFA